MQVPSPLVCRDVALELIARAGAVDHVRVALICNNRLGGDAIDWCSCGVSVRGCVDREIFGGARGSYEIRNFKARMNALRANLSTGRLPGDRVVVVDRAVAESNFRVHAKKWLAGYVVGELVFVDPGPWGLTDAGAGQICAALGIDAPGPQPRRDLGDSGFDAGSDIELF